MGIALIMFAAAGCADDGPLDDCGCKLDGAEVARCVSTEFCSVASPDKIAQAAESCCGVTGLTFQSSSEATNADNERVSCSASFDAPNDARLLVVCSDNFSNY